VSIVHRIRDQGASKAVDFGLRAARLALRHPTEALDHMRTQLALGNTTTAPRAPIEADPHWCAGLHSTLGVEWPCEDRPVFDRLWEDLAAESEEQPIGLGHDADPTLASAVWCLVRHRRPQVIVETGVSRGMTSRVILEALELNGSGHLWSVDLPPLDEPWRQLAGSAVPPRLKHRWTYVRGTSARRLPQLVRAIDGIDLFIHDSLHTAENLRFELTTVWPSLVDGAAVVIDDAELCGAATVLGDFPVERRFVARDLLKSDAVVVLVR
jgi:hypothetical protein